MLKRDHEMLDAFRYKELPSPLKFSNAQTGRNLKVLALVARIIYNPMRKRGIPFKSLAYASGDEKQALL